MLNQDGLKARNHTEACRKRFMDLFKQVKDPRATEPISDETSSSSGSESNDDWMEGFNYDPDLGKKYDSPLLDSS